MNPTTFKEQNAIFGANQKEYLPLPALVNSSDPNGQVITCWELSFRERLKLLFTGKIWLCLLTFNKPLTPSNLSVNKKDFINIIVEKYPEH